MKVSKSSSIICYACGDELSTDMLETYVETKKVMVRVSPTCGENHCLKYRKKKCITSTARKADAKWKQESRMAKRLRIIKAREAAANATDD